MDSWYLYHSLINLSRLAMDGHKTARKLLLDSLDYAIKVAHKFHYQWPVMDNLDTLEIIRAETNPGEGGEIDIPGLYAHLMLQAWELTQRFAVHTPGPCFVCPPLEPLVLLPFNYKPGSAGLSARP